MTRILVTRPEPDATDTAGRLSALGIEPVLCPLMEMAVLEARLPEPDGLSGLIFTSANALRALERRNALGPYLGLPVFAVGEKTARAASASGFSDVTSAEGDANALVGLMGARAKAGTYFYPSAVDTARDLPKALAAAGLLVIAAELYGMTPLPRLPEPVETALGQGEIDGVMVYSRRTASIFAELTELVLSPDRRRALSLICLSENTAAPLVAHGFPRITLADFPSEEAMMAATLSFSRGQITS